MTAQLPEAAAAHVRSVNGSDPAGFIVLFADGAVVDDAGRHFRGGEAIRAWAASDIFAAHVTLDVLDVSGNDDDFVITTKVDGTGRHPGPRRSEMSKSHLAGFLVSQAWPCGRCDGDPDNNHSSGET